MNFRKSRRLMWIGFLLGILIITFGSGLENEKTALGFAVAGWIIFMAAAVQSFIFYRCPHCGYSLTNVRGAIPEHCPKCGKNLSEEV